MDDLQFLKSDLQILTKANDEYLNELLKTAVRLSSLEGVEDDGSQEYKAMKVHYAAYLFRKRGAPDTTMPRYLRYELNCLLMSQKAR